MNKYAYTMKVAFLGLFLGLSPMAQADAAWTVRHLVNEQSIISLEVTENYLLLPIQDDAPEGKIGVVKDNELEGTFMNVRLARERVDSYVPFALSAYKGQHVSIDIQGVPENALCWKELKTAETFDMTNKETFRPVYHHTPAYGWMNDPNGMFYKDGVYHLYFQYNPYGSVWGNMHWGHSTSTDLAHWKYEGNPIVTSTEKDFRDPKVFWYAPGKHWCMILAVGQHMEIYSSSNLKEWKKESEFGAMQGAHGGVWECPDMVEIPVEGTREKKWVLICNLNPGGPFGGSAAQYFIGSFDGKKFVNEFPTQTKWLDWGKDNYATVTWNNAPDGRCVALGWMSNWQYANNVPTRQYRSANTIARDLTLYREGGELYLKSTPSPEIKKARGEKVSVPAFKVAGQYEVASLLKDNEGAYEIEMVIQNAGASKIAFSLLNDKGEKVSMYYDVPRKQFVMDRSQSGKVDFSSDFPAVTVAPVTAEKEMTLRLFVDRSSIEAFGEEGKFAMTNLVFPSAPYHKMVFESDKDGYNVKALRIYKLK